MFPYLLHYYNSELCLSCGVINRINDLNILHECSTNFGSSGGPILLLDSLKVIGVHKGQNRNQNFNYGTPLCKSIDEFKRKSFNEISLIIRINNEDLGKKIYILNYPEYIDSNGKKKEYKGLKE